MTIGETTSKYEILFEDRKNPTCTHCGIETMRKRKYLGETHYYCSFGCEFRDQWNTLVAGGVLISVVSFIMQGLNPGSFGLAFLTLSGFILGIGIFLIGIFGLLLNIFATKAKVKPEPVPSRKSNYVNCPYCHHVVLKGPHCTHCGASLE
ncbi:MAG: hypothetical protein ACFFAU_13430 [Candidatus Hodarchaeota archaeon]